MHDERKYVNERKRHEKQYLAGRPNVVEDERYQCGKHQVVTKEYRIRQITQESIDIVKPLRHLARSPEYVDEGRAQYGRQVKAANEGLVGQQVGKQRVGRKCDHRKRPKSVHTWRDR